MYEGALVDCHTHIFPDDAYRHDFVTPHCMDIGEQEAFLDDALGFSKECGVSRLNLLLYHPSGWKHTDKTSGLPLHPRASQEGRRRAEELRQEVVDEVVAYNEWGIRVSSERSDVTCFLGLNPVLMAPDYMMAELDDKVSRGAVGVKLVALDYCAQFDDRRHWAIYDYCQTAGVPILVAPGSQCHYSARPEVWGHPLYLLEVLRNFPRLKICFAHFGWNNVFEDYSQRGVILQLGDMFPGVHADISFAISRVARGQDDAESLVAAIRRLGPERVLFGTNYGSRTRSWATTDVEAFRGLPLTEREFVLIGSENFDRVIGRS